MKISYGSYGSGSDSTTLQIMIHNITPNFSLITIPYFSDLSDKFLGKKCNIFLKTGPNFFLQHLKNKIIFNFVKFVALKKD